MTSQTPKVKDETALRSLALSRWENEGGAPRPIDSVQADRLAEQQIPALTNAEIIALRVRIIALENIMIALLATASDEQRALAHSMISYITPRPGSTQHPLTLHASEHMADLLDRSQRFRH